MKSPLLLAAAAAVTLTGCGRTPVAPAPAPAPAARAPTPTPALREAPNDWHLLDAAADGLQGISLLRAERELLRSRQPQRTVLVAVIDNGVDTSHAVLKPRLWSNPREIAGNAKDDDNNGYVDDIRGWNLIGGRDGKFVNQDTYEVTRLASICARENGEQLMPRIYRGRCAEIRAEFNERRSEAEQTLINIRQIEAVLAQVKPYLQRASGKDSLTPAIVEAIRPTTDTIRQARDIFLRLAAAGIDDEEIASARKAFESQVSYGFNMNFDPRPIVGDDYPDTLVKNYGNPNVIGAGAEHGTHVAGIIAAPRDGGGNGIIPTARIMALRVVPDGDERDKDIALAIRYAVDHGAQIVNMSFGKGWSPYKPIVDAAVKYAEQKGVLLVHGAGNDGKNLASEASFPSPFYIDGQRATNWIEVGASGWKSDSLAASFSNYGKGVDVFAPGVDIYSTVPGNTYKKQSGTSMASPVVAGLAALLMSYYPQLGAADVRRIIMESATKMPDRLVARPGETGGPVRFGDLSETGGVVNAYAAVQMADRMAR